MGRGLSRPETLRLRGNDAVYGRDHCRLCLRLEKRRSRVGTLMFSAETEDRFKHLVSIYPRKRSALIPMLLLAQQEDGYVTPQAMEYIGQYLELSASEV